MRCTRPADRLARAEDVVVRDHRAESFRRCTGSPAGTASRTVKTVRLPGALSTLDRPAHCLRQLPDDRQAEPGADRPVLPVTRVEIEALEGMLAVFLVEARPRILDPHAPRRGDDPHLAAARRQPQRVLDEVGDDLQHAVGVGDRRRGARPRRRQRDAEGFRLRPVAARRRRRRPRPGRSRSGGRRSRCGSSGRGRAGRRRVARAARPRRRSSPPPARRRPRRHAAPPHSRRSRSAASSARG